MDPLGVIAKLVIGVIVVILVGEIFDDVIGWLLDAIILIAVVGGIGYGLYVEVFYPAYLSFRRFISEHRGTFVVIVLAAVALVLLIILLWIWINIHRLLTTDYNMLIYRCNQDIANATKALDRAWVEEENFRRGNEFEVLDPGRHKYGYNPNIYEEEVDRCADTLRRLEDKKQYYEKQRRMGNKLMRMLRGDAF